MKRLLLILSLGGVLLGACDDSPSMDGPDRDEDAGTDGATDGDLPVFVEDDIASCEPASCDDLDADCGPVSDGCGGVLDCGQCDDDEACGLVERNKCFERAALCSPLARAEACDGKECGIVGDGCGKTHDCGDCDDGRVCGAAEAFECGRLVASDDDCPAKIGSCAEQNIECGLAGNGCGGLHNCDVETGGCAVGDVCGAGGPGQCGEGTACIPLDREEACDGKQCGRVGDGCNGSHDCGECPDGEVCGGENAFQCASAAEQCQPLTPAEACADKECGVAFDGCGEGEDNLIDCSAANGGCAPDEYCGLEEPFRCASLPEPNCEPAASCSELGWECGFAVDECGNVLDCGSESLSCDPDRETCSGGLDGPALCLTGVEGGPGSDCPLCDAVVDCTGQSGVTELRGRAITPGRSNDDTANQVGVPNAFVYILKVNDPALLPAIPAGVPEGGLACDRCEEQDLGPVLASARTNATGEFVLRGNIPVGEELVLVTKIGKWRRAQRFTVPADAACEVTNVPSTATRLPRDMQDGLGVNIPRVAITTGQVDAMECVFHKLGVATSEFSEPGADGNAAARVHLYGEDGASLPTGFTDEDELHGTLERVMSYDLIVFDCQGAGSPDLTPENQFDEHDPFIREYVNRGGRVFASHFAYTWIHDNGAEDYAEDSAVDTGLSQAVFWNESATSNFEEGLGLVSVGRPGANPAKIQDFADWLVNEGAANDEYELDIIEPRDFAVEVNEFAEEYVYRYTGVSVTSVQQFAFNTPYGAPTEAICGRVAYSGFHVSSGGDNSAFKDVVFPNHCDGSTGLSADLTDQEKVLLYMLFDVGACVGTGEPEPPECAPVADCTGRCGQLPDGCGGLLDCSCEAGRVCAPGGICIDPGCAPSSCESEGAECGALGDGCGGVLDCGECPEGQVCGGGGEPNKCGEPICPWGSCDEIGAECGWIATGCLEGANCGECPEGQLCIDNRCEGCTPVSCEELGAECGQVGNGCGQAIDCGECPEDQICGAKEAYKCGGCEPVTCDAAGAECGVIGDGCGAGVDCGECPDGQVCGIEEPNQCGDEPACEPLTCDEVNAECGEIGDGCSDIVDCGECPPGETCGVVQPNQCSGAPRAR